MLTASESALLQHQAIVAQFLLDASWWRDILLILHLIAIAIGVGGATVSDPIFLKTVGQLRLDRGAITALYLTSAMVWLGIALAVISGSLLFSLNPQRFATLDRFAAKMTIFSVLVINGVILHVVIMPAIEQARTNMRAFVRTRDVAFASGAVSLISWYSVLLLGALRHNLPYLWTMIGYIVFVAIGIIVGTLFGRRIMPEEAP